MGLEDRQEETQDAPETEHEGLHVVEPGFRPSRPAHGSVVKGEFRLLAILSVVVGAFLLLEHFGVLTGVHVLWPVFPAFVGAGLLVLFYQRRRHDLVLVGIGSFLIGAAALFFICSFTSWLILTRAWPAFIALVGVSSVIASFYARRASRPLWISGGSLILLALVFFLVFGVNPGLWPVSLIVFGLWILALTWARKRTG